VSFLFEKKGRKKTCETPACPRRTFLGGQGNPQPLQKPSQIKTVSTVGRRSNPERHSMLVETAIRRRVRHRTQPSVSRAQVLDSPNILKLTEESNRNPSPPESTVEDSTRRAVWEGKPIRFACPPFVKALRQAGGFSVYCILVLC
jgi:hypothetical protein